MLTILLRAEGFSCSLNGLFGVNSFFLSKKIIFSAVLFPNFWSSKPWIRNRIRIHLKCWIRIQWIRIYNTDCNTTGSFLTVYCKYESLERCKNLWGFLTPPVEGALFLAALVASCFLGALPPVDLRAVCLVRAIFQYWKHRNQFNQSVNSWSSKWQYTLFRNCFRISPRFFQISPRYFKFRHAVSQFRHVISNFAKLIEFRHAISQFRHVV